VSLEALLAEAAAALDGVSSTASTGGTEYRVGGQAFAAVSSGSAEFRLAPAVARAARSTPDVGPSPRGSDWVVLRPPALDRMALDRARAWFGSAYRLASERGA
jgi:hypothetical protein